MMKPRKSVPFHRVVLRDPVFAGRVRQCLDRTIPAAMERIVATGRLDAFRLQWRPGMEKKPHIFWDSDVAKVLEGIACALALRPDPELEKIYDEWCALIVSAQQPDGYLNSYFTAVEPEKRWHSLGFNHELYCAGHLIEAAVAGYSLLGKRTLFDALRRYADCIDRTFGPAEEGKRRGWPGHEEIELALMKLYRVTGEKRYFKLAEYFINDRGTEPNLFADDPELQAHGIPPAMFQADRPVREESEARGHAVRAVYLLCGMADVAAESGDESLLAACRRICDSIVNRRMYVTGGIGSSFAGEQFTCDYDLANGSLMYAESCAAMGLALFCRRMHLLTGETNFLDTLELALYNGVPAGINLDGDRFFYTNYLEVDDNLTCYNHGSRTREPWFGCSCCPTSFSRFLPQLGSFLFSVDEERSLISLDIPAAAAVRAPLHGGEVLFSVEGNYPYDGRIAVTVASGGRFAFRFRVPGWCRRCTARLNGEAIAPDSVIKREWRAGDRMEFDLDMPVEFLRSDPRVTENAGRIALKRGPLVYALEQLDQEHPLREMLIDTAAPCRVLPAPAEFPAGTAVIEGSALHESFASSGALYFTGEPEYRRCSFRAIPYALWQNRGETNMRVWMREARTVSNDGER